MMKFKGLVITDKQVEVLKSIYSIEMGGKVYFPKIEGKTVYDQLLEMGATIE